MGRLPQMVPLDLLEVWPGDGIRVGIGEGEVLKGLVFLGLSRSHGARILHHRIVRVRIDGSLVLMVKISRSWRGVYHVETILIDAGR